MDQDSYFLPIEGMFCLYKRLIQLETSDKDILIDFAHYLLLYGPDWEEEAKQIITHVKDGDVDKASKKAMEINYFKYDKK
ncbi:MAG: hypothetical protein H0Z33_13665 [Bacillaceae bacterium]|nr:hypothetical protein [Bacillaceae bacterium]